MRDLLTRPFINFFLVLFALLFSQTNLFSQPECVIVIQGYPKSGETFQEKTTDAFVRGIAALSENIGITIIRPTIARGNLPDNIHRNQETYRNKNELLRHLEAAYCADSCKNILIVTIGHGMESVGVSNNSIGGLSVDSGNSLRNDFLLGREVAEIMNKCKTNTKLHANQCYAQSFLDDINRHLNDSTYVGVAVGSSKFDEVSNITNDYFDFTKYFLENYYSIIGNPNTMDAIKKKAAEMVREVEISNQDLEKEKRKLQDKRKMLEEKLEKCKGDAKTLKEEKEKLEEKEKELEEKKKILEKRKTLEEETKQLKEDKKNVPSVTKIKNEVKIKYRKLWNNTKPKNDETAKRLSQEKKAERETRLAERKAQLKELDGKIKRNKEELKKNLEEYKDAGGELRTSGSTKQRIARLNSELGKITTALKELQKELEAKEEELEKKKEECQKLKEEIEKLKKAIADMTPRSTLPPIMELVIDEAFISAKKKTTTSTAVQTTKPTSTTTIAHPNKPFIIMRTGERTVSEDGEVDQKLDLWFRFYKIMDKTQTPNKCMVVGWAINEAGAPISKLKSIECKIDCSQTKFSILRPDGSKSDTIEIKKEGEKYKVYVNDKPAGGVYEATTVKLVIPKQAPLTVSIHFELGDTPPSVAVGDHTVSNISYNQETQTLEFDVEINGKSYHVKIVIKAHGEKIITVDKNAPYAESNIIFKGGYDEIGIRQSEWSFNLESGDVTVWREYQDTTISFNRPGLSVLTDDEILDSYDLPEGFFNDKSPLITPLQHTPYNVPTVIEEKGDKVLDEQGRSNELIWKIKMDHLNLEVLDAFSGFRILKYTGDSSSPVVIDLDSSTFSYSDDEIDPYQSYTYHINAVSENRAISPCGNTSSFPIYSYPKIIKFEPDSIPIVPELKKRFPYWVIPTGVVVTGGIIYALNRDSGEENDSPNAICKDITLPLDNNGTTTLNAIQIDAGSTDDKGITSRSVNPQMFNCDDLGVQTVTLTVTDEDGLSDACTAQVTIIDQITPTAVCQDITVELEASGTATITPDMLNNGSTDNCSQVTFEIDNNTFTCSDIGAQIVTMTVTDDSGNTASCNSTVTVVDQIAPTAVCQDITIEIDVTGTATITPDMVNNGSTDNCSQVTFEIDNNTFTCSDIGTQTVTMTVTDDSGNTASCNSTVTVVDQIAPTAVCQDITIEIDVTGTATITPDMVNNGSSDNCSNLTIEVTPSTFTSSDIGQNQVTLTVVDDSGNSSNCSATVTVIAFDCGIFTNSITATNSLCGIGDGTATITINPLTSFNYNWSNGQTGQTASGLSPGSYTVTATAINTGCEVINNIIVGSDPFDFVNVIEIIPEDCSQGGSITFVANSPGSGPIGIDVFGGSGSQYIEATPGEVVTLPLLPSGMYTFQSQDISIPGSCSQVIDVEVTQDYEILDMALNVVGFQVFVNVITPYPSVAPWIFLLDGNVVGTSFDPNSFVYNLPGSGTYLLQVIDANGCTSPEIPVTITTVTNYSINYLAIAESQFSPNISKKDILEIIYWEDYSDVTDLNFKENNNQFTSIDFIGFDISQELASGLTMNSGINFGNGNHIQFLDFKKGNGTSFSGSINTNFFQLNACQSIGWKFNGNLPIEVFIGIEEDLISPKSSTLNFEDKIIPLEKLKPQIQINQFIQFDWKIFEKDRLKLTGGYLNFFENLTPRNTKRNTVYLKSSFSF